MEGYIIYFLKVVSLQTIFFGCYWLINRKSNHFHFNRYFLLSALILPFFIPMLNIQVNLFQRELTNEGLFDPWIFIEQSLPLVTISGSHTMATQLPWYMLVITSIYFAIAIPSIVKLLYDYYKIHRLEKSSHKKEYTPKGFRLLYVSSKILSFSFLNKIFLSDLFPLKQHEKKTIITHEEYHLSQKHSLDIILAELVRILCWFNPIVLLIQKSLKETHEYLADRHTLKLHGNQDYAGLLKSFKWQEINMMLGSAYSSASIKKRLDMINHTNKKSPYLQILLLCTIAFSAAFLFACEDNLDSFENRQHAFQYEISEAELEEQINIHVGGLQNAPHDFIDWYIIEQRSHPENIYQPSIMWIKEEWNDKFKLNEPGQILNIGGLNHEVVFARMLTNEELIQYFGPEKIDQFQLERGCAIIRKVDRFKYMEHKFKMNPDDNSIHDDFDKMAAFKGGMESFTKYLNENLDYPEVAMENRIEDKLIMQFVINKSGSLLYLNVAREPSTNNQEANLEFQKVAFRALRATDGMWEPAEKDGKYVMSKMTLPIEFKLNETKN
jgi:hypothetical protein